MSRTSFAQKTILLVMVCCWFLLAGGQTCIETDDDRLEKAVQEAIDEYPYIKSGVISITAVNGRVKLEGHVFSQKALDKLQEVVENVEGVKELSNEVIVSQGEGDTNPIAQDTGWGFGG